MEAIVDNVISQIEVLTNGAVDWDQKDPSVRNHNARVEGTTFLDRAKELKMIPKQDVLSTIFKDYKFCKEREKCYSVKNFDNDYAAWVLNSIKDHLYKAYLDIKNLDQSKVEADCEMVEGGCM